MPEIPDENAQSDSLRVGLSGELSGQRYSVAGRIVMSMREDGVTCTWNEYYLIGPEGASATLVQEAGAHGMEWRLFRLVEPSEPITVLEASARQVGQTVNVDGQTLRVSCVSESRVVRIEGQAPEGVEEGDVAQYFNAEAGNQMIVVSWTGDEVEVFRGIQLPGYAVYRAFGLKPPPARLSSISADSAPKSGTMAKAIVAVVFAAIVLGVSLTECSRGDLATVFSGSSPSPPAAELRVGAGVQLSGVSQRVAGRAMLEVGRVGRLHFRHEYEMVDEAGIKSLLVQGAEKSGAEWAWLLPIFPNKPLVPTAAAALKLGDPVTLDDGSARLVELIHFHVRNVEGAVGVRSGAELYGFAAQRSGSNERVVARWDEKAIAYYRVTQVPEKDLKSLREKR